MPKPLVFDAWLPPAKCTSEMRREVEEIARVNGLNFSAVQREAIGFFLANLDKYVISEDNRRIKESS